MRLLVAATLALVLPMAAPVAAHPAGSGPHPDAPGPGRA